MRATIIPVTQFEQNCTLLWCEETMRAAIVDPGGDIDEILAAASEAGVTVEKILLTHAHIDHAGATGELAKRLSLPIEGPHEGDQYWIDGLPQQAKMFGFPPSQPFDSDRWLVQGDQVTLGRLVFDVLHCPGHTPGHVVFVHAPSQLAFVGDVIFHGSIGRTDFPRGNTGDLLRSIRQRLFALGDGLRFVPGHGPMSSVGEERRSNPFVSDAAVARMGL